MSERDLTALEAAARERPGSAEAQAELAYAYLDAGREEQALTTFERALALAPTDPDLMTAAAEAAHRLGHHERTAALCERALDAAPHRPEVHAAAARLLDTETHALERLQAAASYLRMAPLSPDRGTYRTIIDLVLDRIVADSAAADDEAAATRLEPYRNSLDGLAGVVDEERLAPVRVAVEAALLAHRRPVSTAVEADFADHLDAGDAALAAGDAGTAVRRYQAAAVHAEDDQRRALALIGEARARRAAGNISAALQAANEAVLIGGESAEVRLVHADIQAAATDFDRALESYQLAEADDPFDPRIQRGLGLTLAALERWDEARDPLQKALAGNAEDVEVCRTLGLCFEMLGLKRFAVECYEEALRLDPRQPDAKAMRDYLAAVAAQAAEPAAAKPAQPAAVDDDDEVSVRDALRSHVRDRSTRRREVDNEAADHRPRCPVCRSANDPGQALCRRCGADLTLREEHAGPAPGRCFIATAACGAGSPEVAALRAWRERALRPHAVGRALIACYEACSPPLARWLAPRPAARRRVRRWLVAPLARRVGSALAEKPVEPQAHPPL